MKEIWKHLPCPFKKFYVVSNFGRVKALAHVTIQRNGSNPRCIEHHKATFLHPFINKDGYRSIGLKLVNGSSRQKCVHRLVAKLFIPNPHHYKYVNHKNENRADERASNLEWCTQSYNCKYGNHLIKNHLSSFYRNRDKIDTKLLDKHDLKLMHKIIKLMSTLDFLKGNHR